MIQQQTLADYSSNLSGDITNDRRNGGHFAAVKLDDFSEKSLKSTTVYSRKDFYKISLITGHATYHYRDREYFVEPNTCALIFTNRDVPYRWEVHNGSCSGYSCMFTEDFLPMHTYQRPTDWTVFDADAQSVFLLTLQEKEKFITLFQKMISEQKSSYQHKYDLLFLYVLECIHEALKLSPELEFRSQTASTRLTNSFKILLANQFPLVLTSQQIELRNAQAFADKLAVHTNYLNRILKTETGKTTTQLISERVMQEARALLIHSDWPISQISHSLGFDEPTHFTQAFRKYTGQTPSALRQLV